MHPSLERAETALSQHAHPALRLSELIELMAETDRGLTAPRLRAMLLDHPDRFRVLDPWVGRWMCPPEERSVEESWVILITAPLGPSGEHRTVLKLRESVRWLSRAVDPRSSSDVSRWYAITLSERAARRAVARRAA